MKNAPTLAFTYINEENLFHLKVNNKPLTSPQGTPLTCPTARLAKAVTTQLQAQQLKAPFYKLLAFSADTPASSTQEALLTHFEDDLIFYHTPHPTDLADLQRTCWAPTFAWAQQQGITPLVTTVGLVPTRQAVVAKEAYGELLRTLPPLSLSVCFMAGKITKSCLLSLHFATRNLSAQNVFAAAFSEELYQQQRYGEDMELTALLNTHLSALKELEAFNGLSQQG